ncbi:hypothetical protein OG271_04075 [Micromonospora rifamycinica]|uniref:hypothetical protein n=1 Tax=Micromonospora rifamycinica TaxID=291594 RepID=UPI002E2B189C|nr:hypothetical protein [Micromonospora rifamycinica]
MQVPFVRDITTLAAGAAGFAYSLATEAGWPPLLVSAGLMAGPGVLQLVLAGLIPGGGLSSVPASPEPQQPSPSPSSAPSAGGDR